MALFESEAHFLQPLAHHDEFENLRGHSGFLRGNKGVGNLFCSCAQKT